MAHARTKDVVALTCGGCGEVAPPGTARCPKCKGRLRPLVFEIVVWLGIVLSAGATLGLVVEAVAKNDPAAVMGFVVSGFLLVTLVALRSGRHWAWFAMQVVLCSLICFAVILMCLGIVVAMDTRSFSWETPFFLLILVVQSLMGAWLWRYLLSDKVYAFCSTSRREGPAMLRCRKCGEETVAGAARCPKCGDSLRPVLLGIITLAMVVTCSIGALAALIAVIGGQGWLALAALLLLGVTAIVAAFLRRGEYWAWATSHVLLSAGFGAAVIDWGVLVVLAMRQQMDAVDTQPSAPGAILILLVPLLAAAIPAAVLYYLRTDAARSFCAGARFNRSLRGSEKKQQEP